MDKLINIYNGVLSDTEETNIYQAPSESTVIIKEIILCNINSESVDVKFSFSDTYVLHDEPISPNETYRIEFTSILEEENFIKGSAGSADSIHCYISGIEIT